MGLKMKTTPGTWRVGVKLETQHTFCPNTVVVEIVNRENEFVACVNESNDFYEANARLITTAPELLVALQEYTERQEAECLANGSTPDGLPEYDRAMAVIKKAKGEA
jgi:hypothetical protein